RFLFSFLNQDAGLFQIDFDQLDSSTVENCIESCDVRGNLKRLNGKKCTSGEWEKDKVGKSFQLFFAIFPEFGVLIKNLHTEPDISIANAEILVGEKTSTSNFLKIKAKIDSINRLRWTRGLSNNEKQAGVSILGTISEALIEIAMESLIDSEKFFRSQHQDVQSYGDFVLMCLPNNLWLSVKSNYARERLLASGFSSDIIGVGFFTDYKEFTSRSKIRNFLKVGFLAMYVPDIAISEEQLDIGVSTFQQLEDFYRETGFPKNINGKPFLRPMSQLHSDLSSLLQIEDTSKRTIVNF
ncbi:MAG: hypothetical protein LW878_02775, partial [Proteobacteria bacterium]|nr:hypothetical protein [Pseudomonadota bacterium]